MWSSWNRPCWLHWRISGHCCPWFPRRPAHCHHQFPRRSVCCHHHQWCSPQLGEKRGGLRQHGPTSKAPSLPSTPPSCCGCPSLCPHQHLPLPPLTLGQPRRSFGWWGMGHVPCLTLPNPDLLQDFPGPLSLADWGLQGACWKLLKARELQVPRRPGQCAIL